jgi:redox-regulated HSP33 family molecular chaperone
MHKPLATLLVAAVTLGAAGVAHASETITYTYDAKGRLVKVVHTGTVNNNVQTTYTHDKADNRKNTTTTGSPN